MEILQSSDLNHWQLWSPLVGGIILYIGLKIRVVNVEDDS